MHGGPTELWCRLLPTAVGLNVLGWIACIATTSAIIFGLTRSFILRPDLVPMTLIQSVVYITLTRTVWGLCVAWIIIMCSCGKGGPINAFLSIPVLKPLSRLTYMAYLVHEIVLMWHVMGSQQAITLSDINMVVYFFSYLTITYTLATLTTLMWEAPFMAIEKMIFTIPRQKIERPITIRGNNNAIESTQEIN
ncbi:nose resistant to fluoxetine protein 6 [Plakobranchus ocellatus]|uniref:Nose resistant to fluoxetine protein 6 n=1 Tax=Plakobranchus ocellatus TaxID=259542 RepID=A0AAV3Z218_9GAST|nr:nose resistant to fluoxetine protein 6 [Plakobranchus ocellatus]